jgi:hypothetical protein
MKKLKIFLIALAVIILGVGGYVAYELKFKKYEVADEKVDSIIEEKFEVQLEDGTKLKIDSSGNIESIESNEGSNDASKEQQNNSSENNSNSNSNDSDAEDADDSSSSANNNSNGTGTAGASNQEVGSSNNTNSPAAQEERVTVATIKNKYNTAFKLLESQTKSRLNSLISEAKTEYTTKKNNGEKISYGYFYRKYMGAATSLEQSTTYAVNAVVKLVEADLKANGFDAEHAQSFVEHYEKTKEGLRSELMKKVLDY